MANGKILEQTPFSCLYSRSLKMLGLLGEPLHAHLERGGVALPMSTVALGPEYNAEAIDAAVAQLVL